ncbi:MAG: PLP-dependent transferase [Planctomycetota bacterium]
MSSGHSTPLQPSAPAATPAPAQSPPPAVIAAAGRALLSDPCWLPQDLGAPMPDSRHAASACLPLWQHNLQYEEGDPAVVSRLQAAYPRFCLHPTIRQLITQTLGPDRCGLIFPTAAAADRAVSYVQHRGGQQPQRHPLPGQTAVALETSQEDFSRLKEYWQHAGEILSSRAAELILAGQPPRVSETPARCTVRQRVASYGGCAASDVWLFPCGMAAIAAIYRTIRRLDPLRPTVQFGFPYVDTLKIQQRFAPNAHHFLPFGDAGDLQRLTELLTRESISAVFCEVPANPLLTCPDLHALRQLADQHGFLLIVDDTLSAIVNENPLGYSDLCVTSLTKYFSGYGDVLAGSARLNPQSHHATRLRETLMQEFEEQLCDADCDVLERNSRDLPERMAVINSTTAELVRRLRQHPAVARVYYPPERPAGGGRGGLFSLLLKHPDATVPATFDRLRVCKGPNLGTRFTLCCPYTILAHYTELDEVERCGVSRWLLRVSVGIEPLEDLWDRFLKALPHDHS